MAVRAFAKLVDGEPGTDNTKLSIFMDYLILGNDRGDFIPGEHGSIFTENHDAANIVGIRSAVEQAILDNMVSHGITINPQDTVTIW